MNETAGLETQIGVGLKNWYLWVEPGSIISFYLSLLILFSVRSILFI
jgi:hypothetical protein